MYNLKRIGCVVSVPFVSSLVVFSRGMSFPCHVMSCQAMWRHVMSWRGSRVMSGESSLTLSLCDILHVSRLVASSFVMPCLVRRPWFLSCYIYISCYLFACQVMSGHATTCGVRLGPLMYYVVSFVVTLVLATRRKLPFVLTCLRSAFVFVGSSCWLFVRRNLGV